MKKEQIIFNIFMIVMIAILSGIMVCYWDMAIWITQFYMFGTILLTLYTWFIGNSCLYQ